MSGINKTNQLTLGNIVGSSFANTALIVVMAVFPLAVKDSVVKREIPMLIFVQGVFIKLWIFSALSLIGLFIGRKLAVDSSTRIAVNFGLNETIIGLTVVAIATTLPELITSLMAVKKKEPDIVLGNYIGSNLFNILLVLGLSSVINPISVQGNMTFDMLYMILLTAIVFIISFFIKKVPRLFGILLNGKLYRLYWIEGGNAI